MNFLKFSKDYVADFWFNVLERPLHQKIWFNVLKIFGLMFLKDHYTKNFWFNVLKIFGFMFLKDHYTKKHAKFKFFKWISCGIYSHLVK